MPVLPLSTDLGRDDPYVGIMKKVDTISDYFPQGTIHLAVVDPGVGGARRPIALRTGRPAWVGPDNGIFTRILAEMVGYIPGKVVEVIIGVGKPRALVRK